MPIEIAGITLNRIHKITTLECADLPGHRIPGLSGTVFQDTGRHSARLLVEGIYYGDNATENLQKLRDIYKKREEADFLAEIVGQAYFSQVVIEQMEVEQSAAYPQQFGFRLTLAEYVPPPEIGLGTDLISDVDSLLALDAANFMDMIQLPDLLQLPEITDPTKPLGAIAPGLSPAKKEANGLKELAGAGSNGANSNVYKKVDEDLVKVEIITSASTTQEKSDLGEKTTLADKMLKNTKLNSNGSIEKLAAGLNTLAEVRPDTVSRIGMEVKISAVQISDQLNQELIKPVNEINSQIEFLTAKGLFPPKQSSSNSTTSVASTDDFLIFPDNFDFINLLKWIRDQYSILEKSGMPFEEIPYYDEIAEKVDAILKWVEADGVNFENNIVGSLNSFKEQIGNINISSINKINGIVGDLKTEFDQDDNIKINDRVDQIISNLNILENINPVSKAVEYNLVIGELKNDIEKIKQIVDKINDKIDGQTFKIIEKSISLNHYLSTFEDDLEDRISSLILLSMPSRQFLPNTSIINFQSLPEVTRWKDTVSEWSSVVVDATKKIENNLSNINDKIIPAINEKISAVSNQLVTLTVDLNLELNRISGLVNQSGLLQFEDDFNTLINNLDKTLEEKINIALTPLSNSYDTLNTIVDDLKVDKITGELKRSTETIHKALNSGREEVIKIKDRVTNLNNTIGEFNYQAATDKVNAAIEGINKALEFVEFIPVPESVAREARKAIALLPKPSLVRGVEKPANESIKEIEDGLNGFKNSVKDVVGGLVAKLDAKFEEAEKEINLLSQKYEELVKQLNDYNPRILAKTIEELKENIRKDLKQAIEKLLSDFKKILEQTRLTLKQLDPNAVLDALTDNFNSLSSEINFSLVVDPVIKRVNEINTEAEKITKTLSVLTDKIKSETDINNEIETLKKEIKEKITALNQQSKQAIDAAFDSIKTELDKLDSDSIKTELGLKDGGALDELIEQINPGNKLKELAEAWIRVKSKLTDLQKAFDPLNESFVTASNWLEQNHKSLLEHQKRISEFLDNTWNKNYFGPEQKLHKILLGNDWKNVDISDKLLDFFNQQIDSLAEVVFSVMAQVKKMFEELLTGIKPAIEAIKSLINKLMSLNLSIGINNIQPEIGNTKDNLKEIIGKINIIFENLDKIGSIDIEGVLDIFFQFKFLDKFFTSLGTKHDTLVNKLLAQNPVNILKGIQVTELKDDVSNIISEMDVSFIIDILIKRITALKNELGDELNRVSSSYEDMYNTLQAKFGAVGAAN